MTHWHRSLETAKDIFSANTGVIARNIRLYCWESVRTWQQVFQDALFESVYVVT